VARPAPGCYHVFFEQRKESPLRVCLYTRISTDEENQPTSLHSQRERLEAFVGSQEGWWVVAHEEDRATGTKLDRPGLQAALQLARDGKVDLLLVYRVDRLSRKVRQLAQLAEELDRLGVALRSATEPFDTGAAAGRMMLQMLAVFAEFEHATIVDRVTAGIERRAKEGRWASGRVAFGYRRDEQKLVVPDERQAPVVRRVFQLYTRDRLGTTSIARLLAEECAPAPACGWQPAVVQLVLENDAYLGRVHWRGDSYPGLHEPLIDEQTFHAAEALLRERGHDLTLRRGNRSAFLLSGLVRCGRCRRAYVGMSAKGNGGLYHYYACSGRQKLGRKACDGERLNRDKLEAAVLTQLAGLYRDGDLIAQSLQHAYDEQASDRPALEEQQRTVAEEIRRGERALDRYYHAFETGDLEPARFKTRLADLEAELDTLHDQERALTAQLADPTESFDPQALATVADRLRDTLAAGEPEQTKALLRLLIKELRVNGRSEILPTYRVVAPEVCATTSSVGAAGIEPATPRV
jgi:site-specific DNA recombinase